MTWFLTYIFITYIFYVMTQIYYILPFFGDRQLVLGPIWSSFFWPLSLCINTYQLFFGKNDEEE